MKKATKTANSKKAMLTALEKSMGIVTTACRSVGIEPRTHYNWLKDDPAYKEAVEVIADTALDFAESSLFKQIQEGIPTSTIFYLKTKGKKRGYIERVETDINIVKIPKILWSDDDDE